MKNRTGHLMIVGGLVAVAMVSVGGAVAWSRADAAQQIVSILPPKEVSVLALPGMRPLRDVAAIKRSQVPLSSLPRDPFHSASSVSAKPVSEPSRPQLLAAVQTLRLESILCTDTLRSCTISGKTVGEGETLRPFVIEKINSSSVALKSGLYRFELRAQQ